MFAAMGGDVQVVDYIVTNGEIPENEVCTLIYVYSTFAVRACCH